MQRMLLRACSLMAYSTKGPLPMAGSQAKRQTTTAVNKAASDMFTLWTGAMTGAPAPKRKRKR